MTMRKTVTTTIAAGVLLALAGTAGRRVER